MDLVEMLYGQGGEEILQKTASERFITKFAGDYGVDVSQLSDKQLNILEKAMISDMEQAGLVDFDDAQMAGEETANLVAGELDKMADADQIDAYDSQEELLDDAVTLRAMELLDENGYNPDAVLDKVASAIQQSKLNAMMNQAQGGEHGPVPGFKELIQGGAMSNSAVGSGIRGEIHK